MDRIAGVLRCQWRAYWRRFMGAGSLRTTNAGVLLLVAGLGAVRYVQQLPIAAAQVEKGETARYETLLLLVFLAWMAALIGETGRSITGRQLSHFPLTLRDLFVIRIASAFYSPVTWTIMPASLALGFVVAKAPHPLVGMIALLTFLPLAVFTSFMISHLLSSAWSRRLLLAALLAISVVATLLWLGRRSDMVAQLRSLTPARLTVAAATSPAPLFSLLILVSLTLIVASLAFLTFPFTLHPRESRRSQSSSLSGLIQFPGKLGGLVRKDLRYASRLLDLYLALPVVIFFNIYLVSDPAPSAVVFAIIIGVLFLTCSSLAFNCFGHDSPTGIDRYTLLPLTGKEKLAGKNLAFASIMVALFLTMLPHAFWKLGAYASLLGTMELIAVGLAYVSYGNWLSVKQPVKMQFYRFASGSSPVDIVMGMIFGSIPFGVSVVLFYRGDSAALWKSGLMLLIYVGIYLFSLSYSARLLEREKENMRRALS